MRLLPVGHRFEQFGHGQRLQNRFGFDMDGTVGTHRQRGTQSVFTFFATERYGDDFIDFSRLFQAHCFFYGDFVKRVHRHFDVADVHIRTVGLHPHFHVVIHHAFYGNQCFHIRSSPLRPACAAAMHSNNKR